MNFDKVEFDIDDSSIIVARLLSYTPQTGDSSAEIEWGFFNNHSGKQMDDIYPLFKPEVYYIVEKNLWIQLKQRFNSDFKAAYRVWHRDVPITTIAQ